MNYLRQAFNDAGIVELRHIGEFTECGLYDDYDALVSAVYERMESRGGLYITLNKTDLPAVNMMGRTGVKNKDITRILRIPFDFDPIRPSDTASSEEQLKEAERAMLALKDDLQKHGWPEPLIGMSGNGYHLQYRTDFIATPETISLMKRLYDGLKAKFSNRVKFDSSVKSAGQVFRLYGTVNRKGNDESLWRKTHCTIPDPWDKVTLEQLSALTEIYRPVVVPFVKPAARHTGRGNYNALDIVSWSHAHGIYRRHLSDNKHAVLCPFNSDHGHRDETIIFEPDGGWAGFYCPHDGCESNKFIDLITLWGDADAYCY